MPSVTNVSTTLATLGRVAPQDEDKPSGTSIADHSPPRARFNSTALLMTSPSASEAVDESSRRARRACPIAAPFSRPTVSSFRRR